MNLNSIRFLSFLITFFVSDIIYADNIDRLLKKSIVENGLLPPSQINHDTDKVKSLLGQKIFESKSLSNSQVACIDCHLDEFGSSDGLPNSVGIGGEGEG